MCHYVLQYAFNCTWDTAISEKPPCQQYENETLLENYISDRYTMTIDAVYSLGLGLHQLFNTKCPDVFTNNSLVSSCYSGSDFLTALKGLSFNGSYGEVDFDENGDNIGHYLIRQYNASVRYDVGRIIGSWQQRGKGLVIDESTVDWAPFTVGTNRNITRPESVCSYPCEPRHYYIVQELKCCWTCRKCHNNEIVVGNFTSCRQCPENTWPDSETATICERIKPHFIHWGNTIGVALLILSLAGLVGTGAMTGLVIYYRDRKIIKASSRELMSIILVGITLEWLTAIVITAKPTKLTCFFSNLGFGIAIATVYSPLLVKTNRVYRIFAASRLGAGKPRLISPKIQVALSMSIILLQVSIHKLAQVREAEVDCR